MTLPIQRKHIVIAWLLGGALAAGLLLAMTPLAEGAPPPTSGEGELFYERVQTVTLHSPPAADIYSTIYSTTFQIRIAGFRLNDWINLPPDAVVHTANCVATWPPTATCEALIDPTRVVFSGTVGGKGTVYLDYDTRSRAWRDPQSPNVQIEYPVGPQDPTWPFALTNTLVFSRSISPVWEPVAVSPGGYIYTPTECVFAYTTTACSLTWGFTETTRLTFTVALRETLLGSDLVIEEMTMSNYRPAIGEPVRYTVTLRNIGVYTTGRSVIAGLYIRPADQGPPLALTSTFGGPLTFGEAALFKWIGTDPPSYWWAGLAPGSTIVGTTVMTWPTYCSGPGVCGVWAQADVLRWQTGYEWYGHNPEGLICSLGAAPIMPTCDEENNNVLSVTWPFIYLPRVFRAGQ